jgi:hypothetical protein
VDSYNGEADNEKGRGDKLKEMQLHYKSIYPVYTLHKAFILI